jgi:hypothetical protein
VRKGPCVSDLMSTGRTGQFRAGPEKRLVTET